LGLGFSVLGFAVGCSAPRSIALPSDGGTPLADFAAIHQNIARACAGVRTMTAEIALSGRAGTQRLRGRVIAGFARPSSMSLTGVAPFGPPAFNLVSGPETILLLPREARIVRGAKPEEILGALTGVTLGPADLLAVLTGCIVPDPTAVGGSQHEGNWATIALSGGATLYLRKPGSVWVLTAARRDGWRVDYLALQGNFPRTVRLRRETGTAQAQPLVDLTAELSQLSTNIDVEAAAFTLNVPPGVTPLTLEELREAGPLRGDER
jgi:hypothetical protein